jgi:NadR type nicotinamide-nucleotide adenylyltransferase
VAPLPTRIVLIGGESTGKTTLAAALAERYRLPWVPEFARDYATSRAGQLTVDDVEPIARGQLAAEDAALRRSPGGLILDTDLLSTWVYAHHYYGEAPAWLASAVTRRVGGLYLFCDIDLPWIADVARDRGERRAEIQAAFRAELERRSLTFAGVRGVGSARLEAALAAIERHRQPA